MPDIASRPVPQPAEDASYSVVVIRTDRSGVRQCAFEGYGLLRELLDDIEAEAEQLGWLADPDPAA